MRSSKVQTIYVNSIDFSGVFQVGDSTGIYPFTIARAVQKENPVFIDEYITDDDRILEEPIPRFLEKPDLEVFRQDFKPIRVQSIRMNGLTGASVFHVGSSHHGKAISIIKHKRILQKE